MDSMFAREISEEIGIDILDPEICQANDAKWLLVREKMAFVGVCNVVKLNLTKAQLLEKFAEHQKVDDEKEVESLLFIRSMSELDALPKNEKADYVDALYRCYFGLNAGFSWEKVGKLSNNGKNSEQFPIHSSS
jgi:8-oxo-dGTP pyrophosphatase MutT (NUDIX family)